MNKTYKKRTFKITYEGALVIASWKNLSAEAYTVDRAMELCTKLIDETDEYGEIEG